MANFREFYVPAGAGSNFLAKHCLWIGNPIVLASKDDSQNEYFIDRVKSDSKVMAYSIRRSDPTTAPAKYYDCSDKSIISESARIKPILIQLDRSLVEIAKLNSLVISETSDGNTHQDRLHVINHIEHIWREENSMWTNSFFHVLRRLRMPSIRDVTDSFCPIGQVEDFFAKCREYYYDECERNNWDVFQISHTHPFLSVSPRLKFPANIDTMAMEIDNEMNMYNTALIDIKMNKISPDNYDIIRDQYTLLPEKTENLFINKSVAISNKKVSFRKIYFENNEDEIRKMYDFFDNEEYFEENKTNIMSEFRQYHNNNMKLVEKLVPKLYEQLKTR